ncbi:MAG: phosphatidate cytidylyltransferase [Saprospiraceae bacterium]
MNGFLTRASTALVFVVVMLAGLFGGIQSFVLLFGVICALSLWEFLSLSLPRGEAFYSQRKLLAMLLGMSPYLIATIIQLQFVEQPWQWLQGILIFALPAVFLLFIFELFAAAKSPFANLATMVLGLLYIGMPLALLLIIAIDGQQYLPKVVLGLLVLSWANDTGAYMVGKQIGKTPLFPRISPNKTWEGSLAGFFITFLAAYLLSLWSTGLPLKDWLVLAVIVGIFGSIGDLVESMFKRSKQIKDSGNFLPGHGGFLDRFDAFIFLLPFAAAYLLFIK